MRGLVDVVGCRRGQEDCCLFELGISDSNFDRGMKFTKIQYQTRKIACPPLFDRRTG